MVSELHCTVVVDAPFHTIPGYRALLLDDSAAADDDDCDANLAKRTRFPWAVVQGSLEPAGRLGRLALALQHTLKVSRLRGSIPGSSERFFSNHQAAAAA